MKNKHRNILMVSGLILLVVGGGDGTQGVLALGVVAFLIGFISKPQAV